MAKKMLRCCAFLATVGLVALTGCSSKPGLRAPVEDRGRVVAHANTPTPQPAPVVPSAPPAVAAAVPDSNAGKPGYYTVKQGDTLIRIGLESGQSHRDLARWNALENPNRIEVGQVLRVVPPEEPVVVKPVAVAKVTAAPLPAAGAAASAPAPAPAPAASAPAKAASSPVVPTAASPAAAVEDEISFSWPSKGELLDGFDEAKNRKGVDIGGASGDAVLAAADGKVVYADAGLRGYGKLIILKHNSLYLTAYAHNQTLLVKEDQMVKKGQKIAEMGSTDADRVKLHFEVRKQGKPVDPAKYLPAR